jgi:hypothetical protein
LHFTHIPAEGAARLHIEEGTEAPEVEFQVECEPEGSPNHLVTRSLLVPTQRDHATEPMTLQVPSETEALWIKLFQRARHIQTFRVAVQPAAGASPGPSRPRRLNL